MQLPLKIYPSRIRAILALLIGAVLLAVVVAKRQQVAEEIGRHWYMYVVFYGLPVLSIIAGFKASMFPRPQVILYLDGFAYPKLDLRKLPWKDIQGTFLHEGIKKGRRRKFASTESDRRLDLLITPESSALRQIRPVFRIMLSERQGCVVVPIGLMGSSISTRELKKMIDTLVPQRSGCQREGSVREDQ